MSDARDELFEVLMPPYRSQYAPGEEDSTNALLDAYRASVLREAADELELLARMTGEMLGMDHTTPAATMVVADHLRRMADAAERGE